MQWPAEPTVEPAVGNVRTTNDTNGPHHLTLLNPDHIIKIQAGEAPTLKDTALLAYTPS
jgi:hypothetical protein